MKEKEKFTENIYRRTEEIDFPSETPIHPKISPITIQIVGGRSF